MTWISRNTTENQQSTSKSLLCNVCSVIHSQNDSFHPHHLFSCSLTTYSSTSLLLKGFSICFLFEWSIFIWSNSKNLNVLANSTFTHQIIIALCFWYLAFSYVLMVMRVSSMVLLTSVLMLDTKKFMAPRSVSPFLHSSLCVSAL